MAISRFAGIYSASDFAYGINTQVPPLQVIAGPNAAGSGTLTLAFASVALADGTVISPLATTTPVLVGADSNMETQTPSAVSVSTPLVYGSPTITYTNWTYQHGNGDQVRSGTVGLQEAINYAALKGGGSVVVDAVWTALGGTTAMLQAATWSGGVSLIDNRYGSSPQRTQVVLTNAQILTLSSTPVQLLPAPGAGYFYNILKATLVNECTGTAYTAGGAITIGYGAAVTTQALSGTIASTFLDSQTTVQVIQLAGANLGSTTEALYDNQPIAINCASANFATGTGTLRVSLTYTLEAK